MDQIVLTRVSWSPRYSQSLAGYTIRGEFIHTPTVFMTCKQDVYATADGTTEYVIQSWAIDPRSYKDEKKAA